MKKIKVKVVKEFLDKYTGLKHKPGAIIEVTEARYYEIKRSGALIEAIKEDVAKAKEK